MGTEVARQDGGVAGAKETQRLVQGDARLRARVTLSGVALDALTEEQVIAHVLAQVRDGRGGSVMTANLDHLRQYRRDVSLRPLFESATLVVADGMPLVWASRLQGTPLPGRVAGSELVFSLTAKAAGERRRLLLVGGAPGTAERAGEVLERRFPGIQVVGTCFPPFGFETDRAEIAVIADSVRAAVPDLVYVGLPFPKADRLIAELRSTAPGTWFLGLGVSFSFVAGDLRRAPKWMQKLGLEWMHRLAAEPGRLFRRYLLQGIPFAFALFVRILVSRMTAGRGPSVRRGG
jgi:N-acetylglucosaminyldiphosphoundecaprenol N-acetyl-beta-D-mannosaminyltransferase